MELRHLRYFIAVAEELHFGRAAQRLHIVQPALSKQISVLERELGVQLLERTKRHVQLTPAGEAFLDDARRVIAHAETAVERAELAGRGEHGILRIGFIAPALYDLLPRMLREYRTCFPGVRLLLDEVSNRAAIDGVVSGHLDVAFVRLPVEDDPELSTITVSEEPVMLALPAGHKLAEQAVVELASLAGESFVMIPRAKEPALYDHYVAWCLDAGFSPKVVHEVDRTHVAVGLVAGGMGVAFVPACARAMAPPGVVYRPLREPAPRLVMGALWRCAGGSPVLRGFLAMAPWSPGADAERPRTRRLDQTEVLDQLDSST